MDPARKEHYDDSSSDEPLVRPNLRAVKGEGQGGGGEKDRRSYLRSVPTGSQLKDAEESTADSEAQSGTSTRSRNGLRLINGGGEGSSPTENSTSNAAGVSGKKELAAKEQETKSNSNFSFNADKDKGDDKSVKAKGRLNKRQKIGAGLALFTLIGAGGAGFFAVVQGPLEFIHMSQILSQFHLDPQSDQGDARMLKIMRYVRNYQKGQPERSRMGIVGNKIADRITTRFKAAGIESVYGKTFGLQRGFIIDPQKLSASSFNEIKGKSPPDIINFFQNKYKVTVEPAPAGAGGAPRFFLNTDKVGYFQFNALTRDFMRSAGYHYVSPAIGAQAMVVRSGATLHPLHKTLNDQLKTKEEKIAAIEKDREGNIKNGTKTPVIDGTAATDEKGNPKPGAGAEADDLAALRQKAADAAAKAAAGDKTALEKFRSDLRVKYGALGATIVTLLCAAVAIFSDFDNQVQTGIVQPEIRMGLAEGVATGAQIEDSGKDVDNDKLAVLEKLNHDEALGDWSNAMSIKRNQGEMGGVDVPASAKINQDGNVITQFIKAFPTVADVCTAVTGVVGTVLLTGLPILLGAGFFKTIAETALQAVALSVIIGWIGDALLSNQVDTTVAGPVRGGYMDAGVFHAGNLEAMIRGGNALSPADAMVMTGASNYASAQDFQDKSLAYKLFDRNDSKSFIAQVIDQQSADPKSTIARLPTGLLNIGQSFGSLFSSIFTKTIGAAAVVPYDYGAARYGFTQAEMDDPAFDNPFDNANYVANVLDANTAANPATSLNPLSQTIEPNPDNYIARASLCYGDEIVKAPDTLADGTATVVYTVKPPQQTDAPMYANISKPHNNCTDANHDWKSVRMWLFDTQITNGAGCKEGDQQSCIDAGEEADPNAGAIVSSGGAGSSGQAIPQGDLPGFKQVFADDFSINAPINTWGKAGDCDASKIAYQGTGPLGPTKWMSYPTCYKDTYDKRPYRADQVLEVSGGSLNFHLHNVDGQPAGANPSPVLGASQYQTYGRYSVRFKASSKTMDEYYLAWLLWPENDSDYQSAESDWPEGSLSDSTVNGFHHSSGGQESGSAPVDFTQWHTFTQDWTPGKRIYYLDDKPIFTSTKPVWSKPERWQLQTETKGSGNSDGYVYVDWAVAYSYTGKP